MDSQGPIDSILRMMLVVVYTQSMFLLGFILLLTTSSQVAAQWMEAGDVANVVVSTNAFDARTSGDGCAPAGCRAENTRDGNLTDVSRWSCKRDLVESGEECQIVYDFSEALSVSRMAIALYKGTERTRTINVEVNGFQFDVVESSGNTKDLESFELNATSVLSIGLEPVGLPADEYLSVIEVRVCV